MLVDKASGEIGDLGDLEKLSGEGDDDMKRARMDLSLIARISSYLEPMEPRAGSIGLFIHQQLSVSSVLRACSIVSSDINPSRPIYKVGHSNVDQAMLPKAEIT